MSERNEVEQTGRHAPEGGVFASGFYQALFRDAADPVFVIDLAGRVRDANGQATRSLGYARDELLTLAVWDLDPELDEEEAVRLLEGLQAEEPAELEGHHARRDGTTFPVDLRLRRFEAADEHFVVVIARDATERKRRETALSARIHLADLVPTRTTDELLDAFLDEVTLLLDSTVGVLHVVDESGETLRVRAWSAETRRRWSGDDAPPEPAGDGPWAECLRTRRPVRFGRSAQVPGLQGDPDAPSALDRLVVAPIVRDGTVVALVTVGNRPDGFRATDAALLAETADQAWDVVEHRNALEALRATEERYQTTIASSPDGFWVAREDGTLVEVNEAYARLVGYTRDELLGMTVRDLESSETVAALNRRDREVIERGWGRFETRHRAKDGGMVDVEVTSTFLADSRTFVTHLRDITAEKEAERALRESESRFRTVIENTSDIPYSLDADGRIRFLGPQAAVYGIDPEDAVGRDFGALVAAEDRVRVENEMRRSLGTGELFQTEFRVVGRADRIHWFEERGQVIWDASGEAAGISGMLRDVSERVLMQQELQAAQMQYTDFINASHDLVTYWRVPDGVSVDLPVEEQVRAMYDAVCVDANRAAWEGFGRDSLEDVVGLKYSDLVEERTMDEPFRRFVVDRYQLNDVEGTEVTRKLGRRHYLLTWHGVVEDGSLTHIWSTQKDITDRKHFEQSLRDSERRLKEVTNSVTDVFFAIDGSFRFTFWNAACTEQFGASEEEMLGRSFFDSPVDEGGSWVAGRLREVMKTGRPQGLRVRIPRDRPRRVYDVNVYPLDSGVAVYRRDVTEQERSEETIRRLVEASSRKFGVELFESVVLEMANAVGADRAFIGRLVREERVRTVAVVDNGRPDEDFTYDLVGTPCRDVMRDGVCSYGAGVAGLFPEDHLLVDFGAEAYAGVPLVASDGGLLGIMVVLFRTPQEDMSLVESLLKIFSARAGSELERMAWESELRDSEERLRLATQAGRIGVWSYDIGQDELEWDETMCALYGIERLGPRRDLNLWLDLVHGEDREAVASAFRASLDEGGDTFDAEFRIVRPDDGEVRRLRGLAGVIRDANGHAVRAVGTNWDVTRQRRLEAQVAQTRKMEAIGTLAGGIAHDFNNILQAIVGYAQLAARVEGPHRDDVRAVLEAGERARELVGQILTFSRSSPAEIDAVRLQPIVKETTKLLRASLPSTIELKTGVAPDAGPVLADATQLHQVIMNLGTNAYHAMRDTGGTLEVDLRMRRVGEREAERHVDLSVGAYTVLTVSDTGVGMDRETLNRLFEPYFTTRAPGEGTGLGLAIVHSVVADAGGAIAVESSPGEGTRVEVYFPVTEAAVAEAAKDDGFEDPTGSGRVLFVDDEPAIGAVARRALESFGYEVSVHESPVEALESFRERPDDYDIVVTDLTMPKMTGLALAGEVHALRPDVPILLCSGFTHGVNDAQTHGAGIVDVLDKPFPPSKLGWAVRRALGEAPRQTGAA